MSFNGYTSSHRLINLCNVSDGMHAIAYAGTRAVPAGTRQEGTRPVPVGARPPGERAPAGRCELIIAASPVYVRTKPYKYEC